MSEILLDSHTSSGSAEGGPKVQGVSLPLEINLSWCKACNLCIVLCPKQVFEPDSDGKPIQARPEDCNQCTICWLHCPDFAITSTVK